MSNYSVYYNLLVVCLEDESYSDNINLLKTKIKDIESILFSFIFIIKMKVVEMIELTKNIDTINLE